VAPGVRVEPVVKADAYGHGMTPTAAVLEAAGADGFCVATLDEAIRLRRDGIRGPILVLYPIPPAAAVEAARWAVTISVGDRLTIDRTQVALRAAAGGSEEVSAPPVLAVQVEVETGLGRGGFEPRAVAEAIARIDQAPGLRFDGIWTHLSNAADEDLTAAQDERFAAVAGSLGDGVRRHVAASGAILGGTVRPYDSVRPGLAVYGLVPDGLVAAGPLSSISSALRPVLSLHARPTRVADLPTGSGVGYGPAFVTDRPSRIATLPLGYGDGWPRIGGGRSWALVRGRRVPLVGTIAMDGVMADVTDVPGAPVGLDDEFVLIGEQDGASIDAFEVARARTTIVYEVVTIMAARLPRVYHAGGSAIATRTLIDQGDPWLGSSSGTAISAT
jgi:alanine racemase